MMAALAATPDSIPKQAWSRLLVACSLSLLLHLALLAGIPVNPTGGVPNVVSTFNARLEPAVPEPATETGPPPEAALASADNAPEPARDEVRPKPEAAKAETRREPKTAPAPASSPSSGINVPLIRDPIYYTPKQLDVYPEPLSPISLNYPDAAAAQRLEGKLTLLLLIDEFGIVNEATIIDAQPAGYFEDAALAVFRAARFSPAMRQGHPVKSRLQLQVKYVYGANAGTVR